MGLVYQSLGSYDKALLWYNKAKDIEEKLQAEVELAASYNNLGRVHYAQRNYNEALRWYKKAVGIGESLELDMQLSFYYNNLGAALHSQGDYEEAHKWYQKAAGVQRTLQLDIDLAISYNNIGLVLLLQGKYMEALSWHQKAKEIEEGLGINVGLGVTYHNIGFIFQTLHEYKNALKWYEKAKNIQENWRYEVVNIADLYTNISYVHYRLGQLDSALLYAEKNIQLNEDIRNLNKGSSNRQLFVEKSLNAVEIGLITAYSLGKLKSSFSFIEKNRARELQDLLTQRTIKPSDLPEDIQLNIRSSNNQLDAINQELSKDISIEKRRNLVALRDSLYEARVRLKDQVKAIAPEYANLVYPETVNAEQVQSILDKEEVLVSYFTGVSKTFAFMQTPTDLEVIDLGASDSIQPLIDRFRRDFIPQQKAILTSEISNRFQQAKLNQQFYQLSSQLYQKIWAPLDSTGLLGGKEVILIPDGFLNYLPFELLLKDTIQKPFQGYQYLIKDHPISYYPSATVLHFERTKEQKESKPQNDYFGLAVSNFENALCTEDGKALENLGNTTSSVESIQNYFSSEKSTTLFNDHANRDDFSSLDLEDYRYLHFATHGQINSEKPEFSNILLHDGCLNLYEIFELEFNADLVTLSACETGLGKLVQGEGMVGFTRALMYAGTPSVILSLWEVGDDSTKDLFVNYYSKLSKDGSQKYAPLREAQLQMINSEKFSNPYFWAPFVFIGERASRF